jgi:hypothetical protein
MCENDKFSNFLFFTLKHNASYNFFFIKIIKNKDGILARLLIKNMHFFILSSIHYRFTDFFYYYCVFYSMNYTTNNKGFVVKVNR